MSGESSQTTPVETRKLAAIMFTDMVNFSRQMGSNEVHTLHLLEIHNQLIRQAVATHHGAAIKTIGDAFLVDFPSVVHAVQCAQRIQQQLKTHNTEKPKEEQIHIRIGIHLGDIVQKDGDVFGDGVNIASRLQGLAEADTICISDAVYRDVAKKLDLGTVVSLGKPKLKNIAERFPVYALLPDAPKGVRQQLQVQRLKLSPRFSPLLRLALAGLLLVAVTTLTVRYFPSSGLVTRHSTLNTQEAQPPSLPLPDKPSIVVLPFNNMSNDSSQDYFSDGITEDITTDLSKLSSLFVISRNSAFTYKGKAVKVQDISRELGVRYVLEGSVRKSDTQVRITAQLIDAIQGQHLWSERYDRPLQDIFTVQDEIRQQIVLALKVKLTQEEQERFQRAPTDNLEAYDFYLRGQEARLRGFYETKQEANAQARQMFEKAIEVDSQYAGAYAGLGWTYFAEWFFQWNSDRTQTLERAFELEQRAVALDDSLSLSLAHLALGRVYVWQKQHEQALVEAERALALDPNNADGYWNLGNILTFAGRPEEGIGAIEKGMRFNPRHRPPDLLQLGFAYRVAGRYEEALAPLKQVLALNSNSSAARRHLAICYAELGRLEEARAEMEEAQRLNPTYSLEWVKQNFPYKDPADLERDLAALRKAGLK